MKSLIRYIKESAIQGLNGYTIDEVIEIVQSELESIFDEAEIDDIDIVEIWLHGSRMRDTAKPDSDLDAVLFYKGIIKEDSLFNIIHESDIIIDRIIVDVNPIKIRNEQDIINYKRKSKDYDLKIKSL